MKILMCAPDFYGIHYEINPWMKREHSTEISRAKTQWEALVSALKRCGAEISLMLPQPGWPDLVFTANAALIYEKTALLSQFKYKERQGEAVYFKQWLEEAGFEVLMGRDQGQLATFEGAGDALFAGDQLFAGFGFRTQREFYTLSFFERIKKILYCELIDPYFYHLDTCFCPLNDTQAIWYPEAFSLDSRRRMENEIQLFAVEADEAKRFACNAVVVGEHIIIPSACPKIAHTMQKLGWMVHECEMSEYLKSGGACKCLTLKLD